MSFRYVVVIGFGVLLLAACGDVSGSHPLDDSEPKPVSAQAALDQAQAELDEVGRAALDGVAHDESEWTADGGCATNADSPEQGDVSRIMTRSFSSLPNGTKPNDVVVEAENHWRQAGHAVGAGAPTMPNQAITRIDGIGYSVVEQGAGVEVKAFLPCL